MTYRKQDLCQVAEFAAIVSNVRGWTISDAVSDIAERCAAQNIPLYLPNASWQPNTTRFRRKEPIRDSKREWEEMHKSAEEMAQGYGHVDDAPPCSHYWHLHIEGICQLARDGAWKPRTLDALSKWTEKRFGVSLAKFGAE